jgi:hypothetical protein
MDNNFNNAFPEVLPEHPHRRLYILISLLVFVIVASLVITYQIRRSNTATFTNEPSVKTESEKIAEFNSKLLGISESMKEAGAGQVTLSDTELKRIADNMNKTKKK